ncbi:ATP-dependent Clp protease ATP-binding subunit [Lentilactobacillus senioris]|uniref:ATP-dependent Clp protease ATP-binding subunit n=1 Tax=Lentilactobacillus senioris TaxID=931534 RepID=UPI002282C87D|nr:ATP-dependent Clp protease ATP-binding subunit [Lentilactobacillus senioris]MCY9806421.1 ATP-dependent Clp protease ATP-binding subunit [Lentilactobacillus senioris]
MNNDMFGFNNLDDILNDPFFRNAMNTGNGRMTINGQPVSPEQLKQMQAGQSGQQPQQPKSKHPLLDEYGTDMTQLAKDGDLDPVIGRDNEIEQMEEVLSRRSKNNPVLIGEAGVGKTAVVEGLAQKIVDGDVSEKLLNKRIISIDVVSLVQGTGVRGQFEERMKQLIDEVSENSDIILFIDEIHQIVGAGSTGEGDKMDAGNILKPKLARGEFQLIGATTNAEFRDIEKDQALARRFQPITVNEPSEEDTIQILEGLAPKYEKYHHVHYTPDALKAAVSLGNRYIQDRMNPDKAIDLIDQAGAKVAMTSHLSKDKATLQQQAEDLEKQKNEASQAEDFEKAAQLKDRIGKINQQIEDIDDGKKVETPDVTAANIQAVVEKITGVPVTSVDEDEVSQLKNLDKDMKAEVIGQNKAIDAISAAIKRSRVGFTQGNRPIGSFLFVGPTGVGKTQTAKALAKELFGTEDSMIRFDMSEYMDKISASKLIGSAPGYVGYGEGGRLTEAVRRHPYSLILMDEIEKAHPDVLNLLLQILDDGRLTDAQGKTVDFSNTVIIMTSNAGQDNLDEQPDVIERLKPFFRIEFLNRIDDIIQFEALSKDNILKILDLMLNDLNKMVNKAKGISFTVTNDAKSKLVELGYNEQMGARPMHRVITKEITDPLTNVYLENPEVKEYKVAVKDGKVVVEPAK